MERRAELKGAVVRIGNVEVESAVEGAQSEQSELWRNAGVAVADEVKKTRQMGRVSEKTSSTRLGRLSARSCS